MNIYPYNSPLILNDSIFVMYGGKIGETTSQQRTVAYVLAENLMTEHLSAFLVPTIITGSVSWMRGTQFTTDYGYLSRVYSAYYESIESFTPLQVDIHTGTALIRNAEQGWVDIFIPCNYGSNYRAYLVYESGMSSGTATQPRLLSALTLAAQIQLNEWDDSLSNEGVADVGVRSFSNQSYSEQRAFLGNTVFGNSATAQRIKRLTQGMRVKTGFGFR